MLWHSGGGDGIWRCGLGAVDSDCPGSGVEEVNLVVVVVVTRWSVGAEREGVRMVVAFGTGQGLVAGLGGWWPWLRLGPRLRKSGAPPFVQWAEPPIRACFGAGGATCQHASSATFARNPP